jgi:hypothetical protein
MTGKYPLLTLCALAAVVWLTTPLLGADQDESPMPPPPTAAAATPPPPPVSSATPPVSSPTPPVSSAAPAAPQVQPQARVLFPGPVPGDVSQSPYLNPGATSGNDPMLRVGWWANTVSGSAYRVGEYQNWTSGPFADLDGAWTDGCRTLDLSATLTDDSDGSVHGYYFGPGTSGGTGQGFEARVDYLAFPHNLQHDPLDNMLNPNVVNPNSPANASSIFKQDLNAGEDYAIQVQEFKANFKGQLTSDVRWTVDVFGMDKYGVRQANAPSQCYVIHNGIQAPFLPTPSGPNPAEHNCHDLSQAQTINWKTTEVTPKLEGTWGALTVEYSHPIRIFEADDSTVTRDYDGSSAASLPLSQPYNVPPGSGAHTIQWPYAVVDNNITNIDQVKISLNPDGDNKFYALMLNGEMFNESVGTNAFFNNVDVRWTNNSIENVTLVTHWKQFNEVETLPNPALVPAEDYYNPAGAPSTNQDTGQHTEDAGVTALWRPFGRGFGLGGLAIKASYDYEILRRDDAIYTTPASPPLVPLPSVIDETYTRTNGFEIRPDVRWSPTFDTYLKYRCTLVDQPLIGVKPINATYDTLLPQTDNLVEIGGTWLPTKEIVCNATLGIEQAYTNIPNPGTPPGPPINFDENSYPYSFSVAYTPTAKWTFTGGYANYTDFISQLITLGDDYIEPATTSLTPPLQTRFGYLGEAEVFDLGATYRMTKDVKLTGAVQYTHGIDTILPLGTNLPGPFPNIGAGSSSYNLSSLPGYSRVIVETVRVEAGVDWHVREHLDTFFRYQYYNFNDPTQPYDTGIASGFLVGFNWCH